MARGGTRCPKGPSQTSCSSDSQVRGLADRYGLRVHMDGARLMNAAVAQGVQPAQIAQHCDSVSLCFSKVCLCGEGSPGLAEASTRWSLALFCRCWAKNTPGRLGPKPGGAAGVTPLRFCRAWAPRVVRCWQGAGSLSPRPGGCGSCWAGACGRRECWRPPPASGCSTPRRRCAGTTATPGALRKVLRPPSVLGCNSTPGTAQQNHVLVAWAPSLDGHTVSPAGEDPSSILT